MPFRSPNQQHQSTEGKKLHLTNDMLRLLLIKTCFQHWTNPVLFVHTISILQLQVPIDISKQTMVRDVQNIHNTVKFQLPYAQLWPKTAGLRERDAYYPCVQNFQNYSSLCSISRTSRIPVKSACLNRYVTLY